MQLNIEPCYELKFQGIPHILIQLSTVQDNCHQHCSITLADRNVSGKETFYSSVKYGKSIHKRKKRHMIDGNSEYRFELQMDRINNGLLLIIANCKEFDDELDNGSIQLVDGTSHCAWKDGVDDKYHPSGYVILRIIRLGAAEHSSGLLWGQQHVDVIKR